MRRGINQLEMVLAFIIFIAAIGGSVFFLQTFRAQTDQFAQIDLWVEKLIDSAQDEVTLTVFQLNQTALGTVLFIALPVQEPMQCGRVLSKFRVWSNRPMRGKTS